MLILELTIDWDEMKILHVIPNLTNGGAERVAINLANYQIEQGNEVVMLFANPNHSKKNISSLSEKIILHSVCNSKSSLFITYFSALKWLFDRREYIKSFDIVHTHLTFGLVVGALGRFVQLKNAMNRPKFIFTCHLVGMNVRKSIILLTRFNSRFYDNFVLMARNQFWDKIMLNDKKFVFIENGIKPLEVNRLKKSTTVRIGCLGRLVKDRKPELVIDLFCEIEKVFPDTVFKVGGDGPLRSQLQDSLRGTGAEHVVEFQGLIESPSDFYSDLDFYVTMNVGSNTGISGLEAVSAGIPTLAIQLDPLYKNGERDWIPSFSSNSLFIAHLQELIENRDSLRTLTIKQKVTFEANFTIESMASKYQAIYLK
jgi:glycosyltransferase involved in cell wall biosynthesis